MKADRHAGFLALARSFLRLFPDEAARRLETEPLEDVVEFIGREPALHIVPVVERLASNVAADALLALDPAAAARIVGNMDPVRGVAVLNWMDAAAREALLQRLEPASAAELRAMAEYPPETAGRLMDPRVIRLHADTTAGEAIARLRALRSRHVSDVFISSAEGALAGRVSLQELAVAPPEERLEALARPPVSVAATAPAQQVVELLTDGRLTSLPVVDFEGRLLGVIRHDTLVKTAQQDVAADLQAMVGASRQERALSRVTFAVRKRLPWLEINLFTAFLAASVVGVFEGTIARFTALAVLMPVVAGQSGNTGAQALAVTMRGLALREIRVSHWHRLVRKEASVAVINSIAVAVTASSGVLLWSGSPGLALVIAIAMILSMITAATAGVLIPMTLTRLKQDPAQSSSIFLTTITDAVAFGSFLGIATALVELL